MSVSGLTYGGRYQVLGRVGAGGMAEVYRARDELLDREVALKVLSERFSRDRSFIERFRREAQSAANLSHPNIVSLFDYGADDDTYFIVMEFIDGDSLSEIIERDGALLAERAAEIAAEVARALQQAHTSGLVHRDIKPGNIMLTSTGQTKVTDFGIARALRSDGEATMTQTGMVIGTAAYLSPEQAQGNPVDARSDVYALGCVLYEMLTGRAPFAGDSPLAIAYKHVRENPDTPSSLNPDVPAELDAITMKAMAKNPDNRYSSAAEMQHDLERFLAGQSVQATPLMADETLVAPATGGTQVLRQPDYTPAPEPSPRRGRGAVFWLLLTLLILAIVGLLVWFLLNRATEPVQAPVEVPNVVGRDVDAARDLLERRGLRTRVTRVASNKPINEVTKQDPEPGAEVDENSVVTLTASKGPRQVEVPSVVGLPEEDARAAIEEAKLEVGDVTEAASAEVEAGVVISQSPEGGEVDAGSSVSLVVSTGPEAVSVPFVVGNSQEDAEADIEAAGLVAEATTAPSDQEAGIVIEQDPAGGSEAVAGDVVRIVISEGPEETTTELPDVRGENGDDAEAFLESELGLDVGQTEETKLGCTEPPGNVCRQDPEPGTSVEEGDSVTLFVQPGP